MRKYVKNAFYNVSMPFFCFTTIISTTKNSFSHIQISETNLFTFKEKNEIFT